MNRLTTRTLIAALLATTSLTACGTEEAVQSAAAPALTWEGFRAQVYEEPGTGVFIVDGDTPVVGEAALRAFFDRLQPQARPGVRQQGLAVSTVNGADNRWSDAQRLSLSYCVSTGFGARHDAVRDAMAAATAEWSAATGTSVRFVYVAAQDGACNAANSNVLFDVSPTSGQRYLARAFFPDQARATRNVLIDASSFGTITPYTLTGILRHELGHVLGFRHEQTRPEAGTCFEDNNWRALTAYDGASVMHYPQCNGTNGGDLVLTAKDKTGAAGLYAKYAVSVAELSGRWFRMTNAFLEPGRSLDTYSNGANDPFMATSGNYSGQYWKITSVGGGYYRLTNSFLGDVRSLDTYSNGANAPFMAPTGNYSGQAWKLTPYGDRCFRLTNSFLGDGRSLDTYSNGANAPFMAPTGNYSGQCWRVIL